ncbi:MAG: hypothetical protein U9N35_01650 [Euryarchaeota archaeon]|nr:hypothetical protein [Euryarchaeota archaeon]
MGLERGYSPHSHLKMWTKTTFSVPTVKDPEELIMRRVSLSVFSELMKPHKYIQENLKKYEEIPDLFFLGFTRRNNDTYLLAMLEWKVTPDAIVKTLDAMSEIVERYEEER